KPDVDGVSSPDISNEEGPARASRPDWVRRARYERGIVVRSDYEPGPVAQVTLSAHLINDFAGSNRLVTRGVHQGAVLLQGEDRCGGKGQRGHDADDRQAPGGVAAEP